MRPSAQNCAASSTVAHFTDVIDGRPADSFCTLVRPGQYKMKNLPAEARRVFAQGAGTDAGVALRLYLPPATEGLILNAIAFITCAFFAVLMLPGSLIVFSGGKRNDFGAAGVMLFFGLIFTWATIYAFAGLRVKLTRADSLSPQFGYWILSSGILARERVREIVYLPWEKIVSVSEVKMYQKESESQHYSVYPAVCVTLSGNGERFNYYFSGASTHTVGKEKVDAQRVNLRRYDVSGENSGEFRMFKTACTEFKHLQKDDK